MIDAHVHVISSDSSRYPRAAEDSAGSHYAAEAPTAEALLELIDSQPVQKVVLVQAFAAYGYDNRYVADSTRAHPRRFAFVSGVDPLAEDARDVALHWLGLGACGLRVIAFSPEFDPRCLRPLFQVAADGGASICLLASPPVLGRLGAILSEFTGVPVVLDHCGLQPLTSSRDDLGAPDLCALAGHGNVYLKLSTRVSNQADGDAGAAVEKLVARFGSERMLWGSDFPASVGAVAETTPPAISAYASTIRVAHEMTSRLCASDRDQVLQATSRELWSLD